MSRLFQTIVAYGAALGGVPLACASEPLEDQRPQGGLLHPEIAGSEASSSREDRCRAPDGGCIEHCAPLPGGGCLDPCFVHTETCSPDCLELDGSCGWPPTK
jgi:hypothetical protein